jgi:sugar lactone lactonase YvrE
MIDASRTFDYVAEHGEGPIFDAETGRVYWVDILKGRVLSGLPDDFNQTTLWQFDESVGCIGLAQQGQLVLGMKDGFGIVQENELLQYIDISTTHSHENLRFNDGIVGPDGAFYAGTMEMNGANPEGKLYRLAPDLTFEVVDEHLFIPNGMGWSKDESTFFMIDTAAHKMYAFDFKDGALTNKRVHIQFPTTDFADGMTMDEDENFWIAMWEGSRIDVYNKAGKKLREYDLPVILPTSCCFIGQRLFISSSRLVAREEQLLQYSLSGQCLIIDTDTKGAEVYRFGG